MIVIFSSIFDWSNYDTINIINYTNTLHLIQNPS